MTSSRSPINALRTLLRSRRASAKAKRHLATLRRVHKSGKFSGHPEDMLWAIEDAQRAVDRK